MTFGNLAERAGLTVKQAAALATNLVSKDAARLPPEVGPAMFEAPAPATVDRMLAAQRNAADQFGLRATGRRVWGYRGRTLSSAAGPHWLRVVCAAAGTEGGTLWNGPSTSRTLPASVPRPDLFRIRDWTTEGYAYRAELYGFAPDPIVSPRPVLDEDPGLPEVWWKEMTAALGALASVPPPAAREAVREEYLRRVIPEFTGHQVEDVTWSTAHGDLSQQMGGRAPSVRSGRTQDRHHHGPQASGGGIRPLVSVLVNRRAPVTGPRGSWAGRRPLSATGVSLGGGPCQRGRPACQRRGSASGEVAR
ncbi:hypothetical protein [Streptomyces sp. NBC_01233]|uniref:hypothetical protein n=1 Tax=Streptomyces sp. NBC_01233 TaxID=2903787 RepID=UPI002E0F60B0|nr:hypothetical protein OG332_47160 [Streptomyces sp. NBC_01233]